MLSNVCVVGRGAVLWLALHGVLASLQQAHLTAALKHKHPLSTAGPAD